MTNAEKKEKIDNLNEERRRLIKFLKEKIEKGYHEKLMKRLEQVNKEIEELIK